MLGSTIGLVKCKLQLQWLGEILKILGQRCPGSGTWKLEAPKKRPDFHCLAHLSATILQYKSNSFVLIRLDAMGARIYIVIAQEFCGSKLRAILDNHYSARFSTQWLRNVNDRKREMCRKLGCKIFSMSRMFDRLSVGIDSVKFKPVEINISKWKCATLLCFYLRVLELKGILW